MSLLCYTGFEFVFSVFLIFFEMVSFFGLDSVKQDREVIRGLAQFSFWKKQS